MACILLTVNLLAQYVEDDLLYICYNIRHYIEYQAKYIHSMKVYAQKYISLMDTYKSRLNSKDIVL